MAALKIALLATLFICSSLVKAEVEDLHPLLQKTEEDFQKAKTHVEHMLSLSPIPNEEKLHSLLKNESEHLACELKSVAKKLHDAVSTGEHQPQVKEAATAAHTHLTEAAATLGHGEGDLKHASDKYIAAAEKLLHQIKANVEAKPCDKVTPILKHALHDLKHDFDNYQFGMHELIGPHEPPKGTEHNHEGHAHEEHGHEEHAHEEGADKGHVGHHHTHPKVHQHDSSCEDSHSKEDNSSEESHKGHHHSHH